MLPAFLLAVALGGAPTFVATASGRCNGDVANALTDRAKQLEAHPASVDDADERISDAQGLLGEIDQEREIDREACASDEALQPVAQQLHAAAAFVYAAQADAAMAKFGKECPAGRDSIGAAFVAGAWLELAQGLAPDGSVPGVLAPIVPLIQARAAAVNLTLPAWADTSYYWKTTVQAQGEQALRDCLK